MIQSSLMAMFLPIVLGGIGGLNGGNFGNRYLRNPFPNTMPTNTGSSGNSNLMSGNRPLTETPPPPPPKEIFPPRVPYSEYCFDKAKVLNIFVMHLNYQKVFIFVIPISDS